MSLKSQTAKQAHKQQKLDKYNADMAGEGMFLFQNNTRGDLYLPRPTQSGRRLVAKDDKFIGDSYYFGMVRTNELKFVQDMNQQESLLTEQPPTVTGSGPVEYVQQPQPIPVKPVTEHGGGTEEVLLNEGPIDGVKFIS